MLKEIGSALVYADVDVKVCIFLLRCCFRALLRCALLIGAQLTVKFRQEVTRKVNLADLAAGLNKRKVIQKVRADTACCGLRHLPARARAPQVVFEELTRLVDPGKKPFRPKKGKINVIMFVGLQGAGKTTTITKFGYHYRRKGWKVRAAPVSDGRLTAGAAHRWAWCAPTRFAPAPTRN